jgi:rod shape-determining protein MreB
MQFISNILKRLGNLFDSFSSDIGIDLGTATTLVYLRGEGIVLCEPSVVAIYKNTGAPMAVGEEAKQMLGRTPGSIIAIRPLKDGVIADFDITEEMLRYFIKKAHPRKISIGPRIVVAVPSGITEVEKRAVKDSANRAGAREVIPVEEPIVAAIGVGLPIAEPQGNMIIDIGGGTTEIAVISLGGIVHSRSIRTGGDEMDSSIIDYMKKNYNLMVGERTAEEIKIKLGSAWPLESESGLEVRGRDLITGLPKFIKTTSQEIREALQNPLKEIIEATKVTLERTPPELAADLIERGIVLCGGGALLKGIDKLISEETGLACFVADDPLTAVALGTGKILESPKFLKKLSLVSTF